MRHFKAVFFHFFLVERFGYDFVILGWFWQWFEGFENSFRFYANAEVFVLFADFRGICVF